MILNFRSRALARLWNSSDARGVQPKLARRLQAILQVLDAATSLQDLQGLTGLHRLSGERAATYAVTVTRNWRVTFAPATEEDEFHVKDVDYEDYH